MVKVHVIEWSSLVKQLRSGREKAEKSHALCEEALVGSCLAEWADLAAKRKQMVDSVTAGIAGMMLNDASRREMAFRSLRPEKDERTRLLVDTNVFLDEPCQVWDDLEAAYSDQIKIFVPLAVFEEIDKLRKSWDRELQRKARWTMSMLREKLSIDSCGGGRGDGRGFWEMQDRQMDAEYQKRREITQGRDRSQDLRMWDPPPPSFHGRGHDAHPSLQQMLVIWF